MCRWSWPRWSRRTGSRRTTCWEPLHTRGCSRALSLSQASGDQTSDRSPNPRCVCSVLPAGGLGVVPSPGGTWRAPWTRAPIVCNAKKGNPGGVGVIYLVNTLP
eukprot:scaffold55369_cov79-Phaeocystis_antarctica.AAC.1